jgi:hypothetical protein
LNFFPTRGQGNQNNGTVRLNLVEASRLYL